MVLRRLFTRALTTENSPTADLYFANACADWIADGRVVRYAPTVFASPTTRLVIRHDGRAPAASRRPSEIYLLDDAIDLKGADDALSPYWRFKLKVVEKAAADAVLPGAAAAVVSSPALAEMIRTRAPGLDVRMLDPYWSDPLSDLKHHGEATLRIAYLGSQVHGPDFEPLAPMLAEFLSETPEAELILAGGHEALSPFANHPQVKSLGPQPWAKYRQTLRRLNPHVALYPLRDTPFNAARSLNKLIEHAVAGAAGLYADTWPGAGLAQEAGAGMALPADPAAWKSALMGLAFQRRMTADMAAKGVDLAASLNSAEAQRALWSELMEL